MRGPRGARRVGAALAVLVGFVGVAAASACSSIADDVTAVGCRTDEDCEGNAVCSFDQGNVCVPQERPPRSVLGFDIAEGVGGFRTELRGCDEAVELVGREIHIPEREEVEAVYSLAVENHRQLLDCADCPDGSTCDEDTLECVSLLGATLAMRQASRLGGNVLQGEDVAFPALDEMDLPLEGPVSVPWVRYGEDDIDAASPSILQVLDPQIAFARAPFRRLLDPSTADQSLVIESTGACQRVMWGSVRILDGEGVGETPVSWRWEEPVASPSSVVGVDIDDLQGCDDEGDCAEGWACNPAHGRCALDLTGVEAASTITDLDGNFADAWVYNYCEDELVETRAFEIDVAPDPDSGLPSMRYLAQQSFPLPPIGNTILPDQLPGDLCLPPWEAPHSVEVSFGGARVELLDVEGVGAYRCCSLGCLPSADNPLEPPAEDGLCTDFDAMRFHTKVVVDDAQPWLDDGCVAPYVDEQGVAGSYTRVLDPEACVDEPGRCEAQLTHGAEGENQVYAVEVTQPVGSVFQSQRFDLGVFAETDSADVMEFSPRVIVRGEVGCDEDLGDGCVPGGAFVMAERVRMAPDEDALEPFFHSATSDVDGSWVLALDPGVYVVTALPALTSQGGPARFFVLDLRADGPLVESEGGALFADLPDSLVLEPGVSVRMDLSSFDPQGTVLPLDLGTWQLQDGGLVRPGQDGEALDLNDPATCFNVAPKRACVVRRLRQSPLPQLLSQKAQFTARDRGSTSCD